MKCSNCGKNNANIRYTRIINGKKTEFSLCEDCARKMGLEGIDFDMPISFSNFLSDFFDDESLLPSFAKVENEVCPKCGMTYDNFIDSGKFGCSECYETFSDKLDSILKNLHGTSKHIGRKPKNIVGTSAINIEDDDNKSENSMQNKKDEKQEKIDKLNKDLQKAIKDERYEDAAKIRDELKDLNKSK